MMAKQSIKRPVISQNPGIQEMERVILQLYTQRLVNRQDIVELINTLQTLVEDLPDKPVYKH
jgi:hypothetical protein